MYWLISADIQRENLLFVYVNSHCLLHVGCCSTFIKNTKQLPAPNISRKCLNYLQKYKLNYLIKCLHIRQFQLLHFHNEDFKKVIKPIFLASWFSATRNIFFQLEGYQRRTRNRLFQKLRAFTGSGKSGG